MVLLKLHFKQLKAIHKSCINNCSTDLSELEEQIRDAEYTLNCISMDCFKLSQLDTDPRLINNYFEVAELMYMEVYAHNVIRIRKLCS